MHKTWKKPLHKRKVVSSILSTLFLWCDLYLQWETISWPGRLVYYMHPLMENLFDIWMQQLPFPTLLKCIYTCGMLFFILLPILFPLMALGLYFAIYQYVGEQHFNIKLPQNWDLLSAARNLWHFQVYNKKYILFLNMYFDRCRVIVTAISSTVDYMRMAFCFVFG